MLQDTAFQKVTSITTLSKAVKGLPKPKYGTVGGIPVIGIGPKGGKIIGFDAKGKRIYASSPLGKKLAEQLHEKDTSDAGVLDWLKSLGMKVHHIAGKDWVTLHSDDASKVKASWPELHQAKMGAGFAFKMAELKSHTGNPLTPHEEELSTFQASVASGTQHDDSFFNLGKLATLKQLTHDEEIAEFGKVINKGTHGMQVLKDGVGDLFAWKANGGQIWMSRAEEAYYRLAKLVAPNPDMYPHAEVISHNGKEGVLLEWKKGKSLGKESTGHATAPALIKKHAASLVQSQVLDWVFAEHDSHGANFNITPEGKLVALDKGQAWKFVGTPSEANLAEGDIPNPSTNPSDPVYVQLWDMYSSGKLGDYDPTDDVTKVLANLAKLSEEQFHAIVRPYLESIPSGAAAKWKKMLARFQNAFSDWESFLKNKVSIKTEINLDQAPAPIDEESSTPAAPTQKPGWPQTKGKVTVHHPGEVPPAGVKWNGKYPGPGYSSTFVYKKLSFDVTFSVHDGKFLAKVTLPGGKEVLAHSPQAVADIALLHAKGLPLTTTSTEMKELKLGYTATKMLQLKAFDFSEAHTTTLPADEPKPEKTEKVLSLSDQLKALPDGVLDEASLIPPQIQDAAGMTLHHETLAGWPKGLPNPGTVLKDGKLLGVVVGEPQPGIKHWVEEYATLIELGTLPADTPLFANALSAVSTAIAAQAVAITLPPEEQEGEELAPFIPTQQAPATLLWTDAQAPTLEQLDLLPVGSVITSHASSLTYTKEIDGSWLTPSGPADLWSSDFVSGGNHYFIHHQPGAPGWGGYLEPTEGMLDALPPGSLLSGGGLQFEKEDTSIGAWLLGGDTEKPFDAAELLNAASADDIDLEGLDVPFFKVEVPPGLPEKGIDNDAPPPLAPVVPPVPAQPSLHGTGPMILKDFSALPPAAKVEVEKLTGSAEVWSLQTVQGTSISAGAKSPHWPAWVPPPGLWVEGADSDAKPWWLTTSSSGYMQNGTPGDLVSFAVVDAEGVVHKGDSYVSADQALESVLGDMQGNPALSLFADEAKALLGLTNAAFPTNHTYLTSAAAMPQASEVITQPSGDIDPEVKAASVSTTMPLSDLILTQSVLNEFNAETIQIDGNPLNGKIRLTPKEGVSSTEAKDALNAFVAKYGLQDFTHGFVHESMLFAKTVVIQVTADIGSLEFAVEATVAEALASPPNLPVPQAETHWPPLSGVDVSNAAMLGNAPVGATVVAGPADKTFTKLENGLWKMVSVGGVLSPLSAITSEILAQTSSVATAFSPIVAPTTPVVGQQLGGLAPEEVTPFVEALPIGSQITYVVGGGTKDVYTKKSPTLWIDATEDELTNSVVISTAKLYTGAGDGLTVTKVGPDATKTKTKVPKKLPKSWAYKKIAGHLNAMEVGTTLVFNDGWKAVCTAGPVGNKGSTWKRVAPFGVQYNGAIGGEAGGFTDFAIAQTVKNSGGAAVLLPGVTPPKPKTPPKPPKPTKSPQVLAQETKAQAEAKKVLTEKLAETKAFLAWVEDHPKPSSAELVALSSFQNEALDSAPALADAGLYAYTSGTNLLLGSPESITLKEAIANWEGFPDTEVLETPLGDMLSVDSAAFASLFNVGEVKGPDGKKYPKGTTFKKTKVVTTKKELLVAEPAFKKFAAHSADPDLVVVKVLGVDEDTQTKTKEMLAKHGLTADTIIQGGVNTLAFVKKADLEAEASSKITVTATEPAPLPAFVQQPAPFFVGSQTQGDKALANRADLGMMAAIKPGAWGHVIRMGTPGALVGSQIRVKKVTSADGDYYEVNGELGYFNGDASKLTTGTAQLKIQTGGYKLHDPTTGYQTEPTHAETFDGYTGMTQGGSEIHVIKTGVTEVNGAQKPSSWAMENTFVLRVPIDGDLETEVAAAFTKMGIDPDAAMTDHAGGNSERLLIKAELFRAAMGAAGRWVCDADLAPLDRRKMGDEAYLDDQLAKLKMTKYVEKATIEVGAGGAHHVIPGDITDVSIKESGIQFLSCGHKSPEVVSMFFAQKEGAVSRKQGYLNGTAASGASATPDMATGFSSGHGARIMREGMSDSAWGSAGNHQFRLIHHPRALKRADWYAHGGDKYGSLNPQSPHNHGGGTVNFPPSVSNYGKVAAGKARSWAMGKTNKSSSNEIMFAHGMAVRDIAGVSCNTLQARDELLKAFKTQAPGETEINGIPLENFFFMGSVGMSHSSDKILEKCKGLQPGVLK